MAKKSKVSYTLKFAGVGIQFDDVQVKFIDEKPGNERKFWLEPVGDKWRLLMSKDFIFTDEHDDVMTFNRDADQCVAISRFGGYQVDLYNVIKVGDLNKKFYYLDEYQPGKLRLTHTDNMFPTDFDHNQIEYIELIVETK